MQRALQNKGTIEFNQKWINKAIEDGNYHFLPSQKIPGLSIGEFIELRYAADKIKRENDYKRFIKTKAYLNSESRRYHVL